MSKLTSASAATLTRSAASGFTESERVRILAHLDAIFQSPVFRNSKRNCALLRFVVERALDGDAEHLKERTIGVEAFGRPADYDTNVDHSVRSAAGEVRRRLAQYYMESADDSGIRIELTPGSYVPQVRFFDCSGLGHPPKAELIAPLTLEFEEQAGIEGDLAHARIDRANLWRRWRPALVMGAVALLLLVAVAFRSAWPRRTAFEKVWEPILAAPNPVLFCFGGGGGPQPSEPPATMTDYERLPLRRMNLSDAMALVAITGALREQSKPFRILNRARATSLQELRQGPFVLLGALNNEWSLRLTSGLRYTFERAGNGAYISDRKNPDNRAWAFNYDSAFDQPNRDYAIVTRLRDPMTQQPGMIVGGIGGWATQAASEFVSTPEHLRKLESSAPPNWDQKNFQAVISTQIIHGSSGPPELVAAYFW